MRAAAVGGVAYHAGKKHQQGNDQDAAQDEQIEDLQDQQDAAPAPAPVAAAPAVGGDDMVAQLENLKKLLDEGVLTQAEFDLQKQKVLAGS